MIYMNNKEEQIKVYVMIGTIVMLIVIFSGITYAFFSASNNKGSTSVVEVKSGKMTISYADGKSSLLISKDIQPSSKIIIDKTFTLTGTNTTSGLAMPYKVGIKYTNGFSNGQLHYYLKRTNQNANITSNLIGTSNQTIPGNTTDTGYTSGIFIKNNIESYLEIANGEFKAGTSNQIITFNLKIQFPDTGINQDIEKGKSFTGEIVVNYENETGVDYITKLYNEDKENNGLLMDDTKDANIRYSGSNPNNYVEFGNNGRLCRIIGIFNVTDSKGVTSQKLKIVRNEIIGRIALDSNENNNWETASLNSYLNGDNYLNKLKDSDKIAIVKWKLGGVSTSTLSLQNFYEMELSNNVYGSNSKSWDGKVGLIYASDYGYASTNEECKKILNNEDCKNDNWLFKNSNTNIWTITHNSNRSDANMMITPKGSVGYTLTKYVNDVYPTLYLLSNVKIIDGSGTSVDPYKLSL